jgi:hemerythrin-like domain-containing protein
MTARWTASLEATANSQALYLSLFALAQRRPCCHSVQRWHGFGRSLDFGTTDQPGIDRSHAVRAIELLRAEHDGVTTVLTQLERAAAAAAQGAAVPADVFTDINDFFAVFVDHCHHSKEEREVFLRLANNPAAVTVQQALAEEHQEGRQLAAAYAGAVRAYQAGDPTSGARLETAARAYDAQLRYHIDHETRHLFPLMERWLLDEDDQLVSAFDRIEEEEIGPGTHERLHGMIESLAGRIEPWLVREPVAHGVL